MEYITMTVEVRGRKFDIEVFAKISSGGSNSYGSDEPAWFSVDIDDIFNPKRKKSVSNGLYDLILKHYEDHITEKFQYAYL